MNTNTLSSDLHQNRVIREHDHKIQDETGMQRLFKQFSFPGGIPSHVAPETPGSIHEGGELSYAVSHAFGPAYDSPNLIVSCVIGDGEAETGPLRQQIGAFAAVLAGPDLLIFTAGIGERAASLRGDICHGLNHLGIALDEASDATNPGRISIAHSRCTVAVVPTNEDLIIALHSDSFVRSSISRT